tara:strand:+ start:271 stop:393 length:123 start_codon:yes stop_codon:yes gene_type:complete
MYNVKRYKTVKKEPVYIMKYGIPYQVVDVCGVKIEMPVGK